MSTRINVGWLAGIPSTWRLLPAKASFSERREPNLPDDVHLTPSQLHGVLPQVEYMSRTGNAVVQNIQGQDSMKHVDPDDFIIHLRSFQGGIERSTYKGKVSAAYTVLKPSKIVVADYFRWLLKSGAYVQELRTTTNQLRDGQSIKFRDFVKISLPVPPPEEQRAIAEYLNRETVRIDTLVEEQLRLIEMLRERRRSVVQRAVAGRDGRDVRQTGNLWWPELPDGWSPVSLRRVLRGLADGPHFSPNYVDDGVMFLSARNIKLDRWSLDDAKFVSEEDALEFSKRVVPEPGDVLYTKGGTTGIARVVDLDFPFQVWVHVAVLKVRHDLMDPSFLAYALNSGPCYDQSQLFTRGATNNDLGLTRIVNIVIPLPPLDEQRRIVAHLDEETAKIDTLIEETERFIELSRERRSALITAAVTGQIDVRKAA